MGKEEKPTPEALLEKGPHGFPARWILYQKSCRTLKYSTSKDSPLHYIECHSYWARHPWQVLHSVAHKKEKSDSTALIAIYKPKKSFFFRPRDFLIKFPNSGGSKPDIEMKRLDESTFQSLLVAKAYEFTIPTAGSGGRSEQFIWRKADWGSQTEEVRALTKEDNPPVHTNDPRPPQKTGMHFSKPYSGWVLIRVGGPNRKPLPPGSMDQKTGMFEFKVNPFPLGFVESGDEIVASYCLATGWVATRKFIFQFWGSGVTGELGEDFTRVAALTGSVIWDDEVREAQRRRNKAANHNNNNNF
ncbi:hypothetical protein V8F06_012166 [Rhypophila decipiens]